MAYLSRSGRGKSPGLPEIRTAPCGRTIEIDEALAAKYPFPEHIYNGAWPEIRRADGTVIRP